jgi:hypothetical protein
MSDETKNRPNLNAFRCTTDAIRRASGITCALLTVICSVSGAPATVSKPTQNFSPIDLSHHLTCTWAGFRPWQTWNGPPGGRQEFNGVPFQIDGVVQLKTLNPRSAGEFHPTRVEGIPVRSRFTQLHLLHCSELSGSHGEPAAKLILHYADGQEHAFIIRYGVHFQDWNHPAYGDEGSDPNTEYAWTAPARTDPDNPWLTTLWHTVLPNPRPDIEVVSLDLRSFLSQARYNLVAATVETSSERVSEGPLKDGRPMPRVIEPVTQRLQLVDGMDGSPVANAQVVAWIHENDKLLKWGAHRTDARGEVTLDFPAGTSELPIELRAVGPRHAPAKFSFVTKLQSTLTFKMPRGRTVGGMVQDERGQPVAGAAVIITAPEKDALGKFVLGEWFNATTGADGRWSLGCAPEAFTGLIVTIEHPDFLPATYEQDDAPGSGPFAVRSDELSRGQAIVRLKAGEELNGVVTTAGGPVSEAQVTLFLGDTPKANRRTTRADKDGQFKFRALEPGAAHLLVTAPGSAPALQKVETKMHFLAIDLRPAKGLQAAVHDPSGQPVAHARFDLTAWNGAIWFPHFGFTDGDGKFQWNSAPADGAQFNITHPGFRALRDVLLTSSASPTQLTLERNGPVSESIRGAVVDAETGEAIKSFVVIEGIPGPGNPAAIHWFRQVSERGNAGRFEHSMHFHHPNGNRLLVESPGYEPAISEPFAGSANLSFKLKRGTGPAGIVLDPQGRPLAGATLVVADAQNRPFFTGNGELRNADQLPSAQTDASGRFVLPSSLDPGAVVAIHTEGFLEVSVAELRDKGKLQLQPWGRVTGVLKVGEHSPANATVSLQNLSRSPDSLWVSLQAKPGPDGKFQFDRVPAGPRQIALQFPVVRSRFVPQSHGFVVDVRAGETTNIVIGGTGRTVRGRVKVEGDSRQIQWDRDVHQLVLKTGLSEPVMRPPPAGLSLADQNAHRLREQQRLEDFWKSSSGQRAVRASRSYLLQFENDGRFHADNVPAGAYELNLRFTKSGREEWEDIIIATLAREVAVPQGDTPLDLGEIILTVKP